MVHSSDDPRVADLIVAESRIPSNTQTVVALVGVPQHIGVARNGGRAGAEKGPEAIRAALKTMATSAIQKAVEQHQLAIVDMGDLSTEGKTLEQIHDEQHDVVARCLRRGFVPIVLGGGHDVAWPTIRALETLGAPYSVINIDAHADVRPLRDGKAHSGSPFGQMLDQEQSHLVAGGFVEFGLQHHSVAASHLERIDAAGMNVMMFNTITERGVEQSWSVALQASQTSEALYVSLDMDAISSAFAPGVSAPAAIGFFPQDIALCCERAAASGRLRVFDVVEVNPVFDVDGRTSKLAAVMIMHVLKGLVSVTGENT